MLLFLHHHRHINCSIKVSPSSSSRNDSTKCTFKQHSGTYLRHHLLGGMCAMCLCCCAPKVASTIQCNKISAKGEGKKEERKKTGNDDEKLHFKCKEAIDRQKSVSIQSNTGRQPGAKLLLPARFLAQILRRNNVIFWTKYQIFVVGPLN